MTILSYEIYCYFGSDRMGNGKEISSFHCCYIGITYSFIHVFNKYLLNALFLCQDSMPGTGYAAMDWSVLAFMELRGVNRN